MEIDPTLASQLVRLVLEGIHREYPHSGVLWLESEADIQSPRSQHPIFYGCLDWHSAVHSHWLLVRLIRILPDAPFQTQVRTILDSSLTPTKIQGEVAYLRRHSRFECPYGWAWLLQLAAELREWPDAQQWLSALEPLENIVGRCFQDWLQTLECPDRTGAHRNTAFALGLAFDWSQVSDGQNLATLICEQARRFYGCDRNAPLQWEPLGYDFISPCLAEADLMRRILNPSEFGQWLDAFLPDASELEHLRPVGPKNPEDYHQAHFRGLNLSRAWMLEGIRASLPPEDPHRSILHRIAQHHRQQGLSEATHDHYASSHWVGTFAVYLLTGRGL